MPVENLVYLAGAGPLGEEESSFVKNDVAIICTEGQKHSVKQSQENLWNKDQRTVDLKGNLSSHRPQDELAIWQAECDTASEYARRKSLVFRKHVSYSQVACCRRCT